MQLVWIESICNDDKIIENNIRSSKLTSPDYEGVDPEIVLICVEAYIDSI